MAYTVLTFVCTYYLTPGVGTTGATGAAAPLKSGIILLLAFLVDIQLLGFQMQTRGLEIGHCIMIVHDCIFVGILHFLQRDTAGQERFYTFTKQFFRGTQVTYVHVHT